MKDKINTEYKVGDLIYDANIYDGLNTFLSDLQFYKKWMSKNKNAKILELSCGTGRLILPIPRGGLNGNTQSVERLSKSLQQSQDRNTTKLLNLIALYSELATCGVMDGKRKDNLKTEISNLINEQ